MDRCPSIVHVWIKKFIMQNTRMKGMFCVGVKDTHRLWYSPDSTRATLCPLPVPREKQARTETYPNPCRKSSTTSASASESEAKKVADKLFRRIPYKTSWCARAPTRNRHEKQIRRLNSTQLVSRVPPYISTLHRIYCQNLLNAPFLVDRTWKVP